MAPGRRADRQVTPDYGELAALLTAHGVSLRRAAAAVLADARPQDA